MHSLIREDELILPWGGGPCDSSRFFQGARYPLLQSYWGKEAIAEEEGATVWGRWRAEALEFFLRPAGQKSGVGRAYRLGVQIDPVGDLESFFELGWTSAEGAVISAVYRRARSGYKRDAAWTCEGATFSLTDGTVRIVVPIAELWPNASFLDSAPPEGWRINAFFAPHGGRTLFLSRPPKFSLLRFCSVDKLDSF